MRTRFLFISLLVFLISSTSMKAQSDYSSDWKKVNDYENQSLPKSALEEVDKIYSSALKEGNNPQLIKSLLFQLKYLSAIDNDLLPEKLKEIEAYTDNCKDVVAQSVLRNMLAQLYSQYYFEDIWTISYRTAIVGHTPEDMREWSANLFIEKIVDNILLSVQPVEELVSAASIDYEAILKTGESSRNLRPTMYDFLMNEGINVLDQLHGNYQTRYSFEQTDLTNPAFFAPVESFLKLNIEGEKYDLGIAILKLYQDILEFRFNAPTVFYMPPNPNNPNARPPQNYNREALLMVNLERLEFVKDNFRGDGGGDLYIQALNELEKEYGDLPCCVEILYKKADYYSRMGDQKRAYELCVGGIERYPDYERIGLLQNLLNSLTQSVLRVNTPNTAYPGKDLELSVYFRNVDQFIVEIYKINAPITKYANHWNRAGLYKEDGQLVETFTINLPNEFTYHTYDSIVKIPTKELGCYEYVIKADKISETTNKQFSVSRLASFLRIVDDKREFLVTDRVTGKPVEGATIHLYQYIKGKATLLESFNSDKNGLAVTNNTGNDNLVYQVSYGDDVALITSSVSWYSSPRSEATSVRAELYTDRSIYRPGQTVYLKGIVFEIGKEVSEVVKNESVELTFYDANYEEIATKEFRTNEFGSFSGEFIIPTGLLNGTFTIESDVDHGSVSIQVEEYKRPTFDVKFPTIEETYSLGDSVVIKGEAKSFSGTNVQEAEVSYRVTRRSHWLSRFWSSPIQVTEGTITTKDDGSFEFGFIAEKAFEDKDRTEVAYVYDVEVDVTNLSGETQFGSTSFAVGDISMGLSFSGISNQNESLKNLQVSAANLNGHPIETTGTYVIYRLISQDNKIERDAAQINWVQDTEVMSGSFVSNKKVDGMVKKELPSGRYRIMAKAKDKQGRDVAKSYDFTIATTKDKRPPVPVYQWSIDTKTNVAVGEKAEIIYGSSAKDVYVLYEIFGENRTRLSVSRFKLNNENKKIEIPYLESYGDQVVVNFTFVKDGEIFSKSTRLNRKKDDKSLVLAMETFRDKLLPGQKEEWRISIKDAKNNPAEAELLAAMYDASLDKINEHIWHFYPVYNTYVQAPYLSRGREFESVYASLLQDYDYVETPTFSYDSFNWFGFNMGYQMLRSLSESVVMAYGAKKTSKEANLEIVVEESEDVTDALKGGVPGVKMDESSEDSAVRVRGMSSISNSSNALIVIDGEIFEGDISLLDSKDFEDMTVLKDASATALYGSRGANGVIVITTKGGEKPKEEAPVQVRQNFNETAFFYPQLKTNAEGETVIAFTVPESNTSWKLMGLAHTKDLKYGQIVKTAVSQKKLMVAPNMPRFIREGDKTSISALIHNLSDETLSGTAQIECFDPNTEKTTIVVADASQSFRVEAGKSVAIDWSFDVPMGLDMTAIKVVAKNDTYSDGEQHLIPVMPNRMMVTESMPMNVRGNSSKSFSFNKLINNTSQTLESYRLTLELTANPIWYAVQALPAMQTPQSDNAISWFAAYYANNLASYIANTTPKVKNMIDMWTKQGGTKETLLSNLEKNEELKAVLLEETPWVMQAKGETEQKQRLSLLFDINRNNNLNRTAITKLQALQTSEGGFSWFAGMSTSRLMTQYILYGLGNLRQLGAINADSEIESLIDDALDYIDYEIKNHFDDYKKNNKKWKELKSLSYYELEYLFVRSYYADTRLVDARDAADFYKSVVAKYWAKDTDLYKRALMAVIMKREGNDKVVDAIIKSLREHATQKEELGMYWANNTTWAFMFQSATCVHTFIMEAFAEAGASTAEMDEMKLWLLKQKQTQEWESTPATVNAVNILLKTGSNWLASEGNVEVSMGGKPIESTDVEAGTGYIKEIVEAANVTPDMGKVTLNKTDEGPAWGALYWQYFEDLDKITQATTELNVQKAFFVEKVTSTGKTLVPANDLKVGDKLVVRLTVRTDRDMEYVLLKDMRAACFEPVDQISGIRWRESVIYYQSPKDASTNFYFYNLPKGTYVFEYPVYVTRSGDYSTGITTIQSMYAPEYTSHTAGQRIEVK